MKRILLLLLISLSTTILSFSQTSYPKITNDSMVIITPAQLKKANLIFLKYNTIKKESESLKIQVSDLKRLYEDEVVIDSLYEKHIEHLNDTLIQERNLVTKKQKTITKTKNWLKASVFINVITIICLLL